MIFRVEAKDPRIINILTASQEDLKPLKERVGSNGSINMLMHAYFLRDPQEEGQFDQLPEYEGGRDTLVQASSEEPVIIGEEARTAKSLPLRIKRRLSSPPEQIYVCTTEYDRANPQKPGLPHSLHRKVASFFNQNQREKAWDQLAKVFNWLRVENVALGGQYLTYVDVSAYPESSVTGHLLKETLEELAQPGKGRLDIPGETGNNKFLPSTCVGSVALNLVLKGFNVALTLPSSPKKIIKLYEYC